MNYATVESIRQILRHGSTDTSEDHLFAEFLEWSSRFVDWYKGRTFDIRYDTLLFDCPQGRSVQLGTYDQYSALSRFTSPSQAVVLDHDLLEVFELLNGNDEEITDYLLRPGRSFPKTSIGLRPTGSWTPDEDGNYEQVVSVSGIWGYVPHYNSGAFVDTLEELAEELMVGNTTIWIEDRTSPAADGQYPRIQDGHLLRLVATVADVEHTEFLHVVSHSDDSGVSYDDLITVERGYNGTDPFAFPAGTKIEVFRPWAPIVTSVVRLTQWRYAQKDSGQFDKQFFAGTGVMSIPANLPADVLTTLGSRGRPQLL